MKYSIRHIITLLAAVLCSACVHEQDMPVAPLQGTFSLGLSTDLAVEVETRAAVQLTSDEAADYLVTLWDNGMAVWTQKRFADVTPADCTQPLNGEYTVTAENLTEADAERTNAGWGSRRYAGTSEAFTLVANQTTHVAVPCSMTNAGLTVVFEKSFTDFFTDYAVTTDDRRALKFSSEDAPSDGVYPTAFYNIPDGGASLSLDVIITAAAGWDGTTRLTRTLTLQPGRIIRLHIYKGIPEPVTGTMGVFITYDETFDEGTTEEVELE